MSGSDTPARSLAAADVAGQRSTKVFSTQEELSEFLATAKKDNTAIVPARPHRVPAKRAELPFQFVDLSGLNRMVEHAQADQVVRVQTGMLVRELNAFLEKHHQWWPVSVPDEFTVFDVITGGYGGSVERLYGSARDLTLGLDVLLSDGTSIRCGGKVVKNVTGYDMTKLHVGSRGWLGLPLSAWLRLYALPAASHTLSWLFESPQDALIAGRELLMSGLPLSRLDLFNRDWLNGGAGYFLSVQAQGLPAVVEQVVGEASAILGAVEARSITGNDERDYWAKVANEFCAESETGDWMRVSMPSSLMPVAFHSLSRGAVWQASPGSGRISVIGDGASVQELAARLSEGRSADEPIIIAISDDELNYRVRYLPDERSGNKALKERLKAQLDPAGVMNPFVSL